VVVVVVVAASTINLEIYKKKTTNEQTNEQTKPTLFAYDYNIQSSKEIFVAIKF
jgi:hypothetical protein